MTCHRIFSLSRWTETTLLIGLLALSGSAFTYAADSWIQIGPEGGSLSALVIDPVTPSTLYAGTLGGGVFRSRNGGDSWVGINSGSAWRLGRDCKNWLGRGGLDGGGNGINRASMSAYFGIPIVPG